MFTSLEGKYPVSLSLNPIATEKLLNFLRSITQLPFPLASNVFLVRRALLAFLHKFKLFRQNEGENFNKIATVGVEMEEKKRESNVKHVEEGFDKSLVPSLLTPHPSLASIQANEYVCVCVVCRFSQMGRKMKNTYLLWKKSPSSCFFRLRAIFQKFDLYT